MRKPRKRYSPRRREEDKHRINDRIRAKEVRVVGEDIEQGVYPIEKARALAKEQKLDLVEIAPNAKPPVCKIIDYSKFKYEQKKKQKELKAKAQKVVVKEVRFGPNTDDHDLEFKTRHAKGFLEDGNKVKAYVHFVGRTIVFKDRGREILDRFTNALEEYGKMDSPPKMEGKRMIVILSPLPSNKPKKKKEEEQQQEEEEN
ncbi:MAG: translation initiation factor IF-3 [Bernardetiaceae bacterium]|nr:translation initiation factor IF-3 [Bernardetiaceae bacterium]